MSKVVGSKIKSTDTFNVVLLWVWLLTGILYATKRKLLFVLNTVSFYIFR